MAIVGRMDMLVDRFNLLLFCCLPSICVVAEWPFGGGATGEWYYHVPHAQSGTSAPVLMGYIQVSNTINS